MHFVSHVLGLPDSSLLYTVGLTRVSSPVSSSLLLYPFIPRSEHFFQKSFPSIGTPWTDFTGNWTLDFPPLLFSLLSVFIFSFF